MVEIKEPSIKDTVDMLKGLKYKYEEYHGVTISQGAVTAAVALSVETMAGRRLPDKAIGVLDETAARMNMEGDRRNMMKSDVESCIEEILTSQAEFDK